MPRHGTRARWTTRILAGLVLTGLAFPIINSIRLRQLQATDRFVGATMSDDQIERQIDRLTSITDARASFGLPFLPAPPPYEGSAGMIDEPAPGSAAGLLRPLVAAG